MAYEGMMRRGLKTLAKKMEVHGSETITLRRKGWGELRLPAVAARFAAENDSDEAAMQRVGMRDYIIRREHLVSSGFGDPKEADEIIQAFDDGSQIRCRVLSPGGGESHIRQCDVFGISVRIHCRIVGRS